MDKLIKYPHTTHLKGSQLGTGDNHSDSIPITKLFGKYLVIEEKMDGSNTAISFDKYGKMFIQSRGHFLTGGPRERQYALLKQWANTVRFMLWEVLSYRYILYGEWLYAKHTIFYDNLDHYWFEFDLYDKEEGVFLDTPTRMAVLAGLPIRSVRVIKHGPLQSLESINGLIKESPFISSQQEVNLATASTNLGLRLEETMISSDTTGLMEGLYIKWEDDGIVKGRYKLVRPGFLQTMILSGEHWQDRPIIPNMLGEGNDIFNLG